MIKQLLHANWTARAVGDVSEVPQPLRGFAIPATVPGCIHTDLLRIGKIPDPYLDQKEFATRWIGQTDWEFSTTFDADEKLFEQERIDLVCDGLDTIARIELNGTLVAETQNMHRGYRFDVHGSLRRGSNELRITFASPVKYAEAMHAKYPRPYVNGPGGPFNAIRKMACNFGWDWGPALPTCGIWRGIRLEGWSVARVSHANVSILSIDNDKAIVRTSYRLERTASAELITGFWWIFGPAGEADLEYKEAGPPSQLPDGTILRDLVIANPQRWWPVGHGAQPLYGFELELTHYPNDIETTLVECPLKIGLRTVELDSSPDDIGRKFVLKVNGKPIFCKGFNWIPDDCFLNRACEPGRVRERIQQAVDAGGNMLRVWGGGIFETDDFYSLCDEMGVLVWQDFLFACAMYAEEEPFWSEVEAEARYNVARLAHHPSLAIWNGCNENIWAYRDWGWKDHADVKGKTWGKGFYFDLLPKVCKELTPTIPYWAGSPWSGDYDVDNGVPPNAATHGNKHVWEAWFKEDYSVYRTFEPRFCSEFGFQGPAPYSSIAKVVPPEARDFGSMEMRHRQKSGDPVRDDGDRRNLKHLIRNFNLPGAQELLDSLPLNSNDPVPECGAGPLLAAKSLPSKVNFDDLHYLLSVNQSRALTLGVEWFRSRQPTCMGTLYWQLNDCWPGGTTWSCIDGDGKPKLLWYATRRFFAGLLGTFQLQPDGTLSFNIINDTDEKFSQRVHIFRTDFNGNTLARQERERLTVPPRSVGRLTVDPEIARAGDPSREMLVALFHLGEAHWFFAPDRELNYPKPEFRAEFSDGKLTVRARTLMRDICIFADRLDQEATVSEQLVTLLPGESFVFKIDSKLPLTKEALTSPPVLRCVNEFGARRDLAS
jgi:beta-mannosidase